MSARLLTSRRGDRKAGSLSPPHHQQQPSPTALDNTRVHGSSTTTTTKMGSSSSFWRHQRYGLLPCLVSVLIFTSGLLYLANSMWRGSSSSGGAITNVQVSKNATAPTTENTAAGGSPTKVDEKKNENNNMVIDKAMEKAVEHLVVDLHINFVALDFDLTVLDIHTGGRWKKSADELVQHHIRPEFRQFILACLNRNNGSDISVSIVTFTPQTTLVESALVNIVGGDVKKAERIPIRGEDGAWSYQGGVGAGTHAGKQAHMGSAVEELMKRKNTVNNGGAAVKITNRTMLLIDDDKRNIQYASSTGIRGIWFHPDRPQDLAHDIATLV